MTADELPEITTTTCPGCQTEIAGVNDRYACPMCGWVSAEDDKCAT